MMDRTIKVARVFGIWVFGLAASTCAGAILGTAVKYGYENEQVPGGFAGLFAFVCFRLWMGESKSS